MEVYLHSQMIQRLHVVVSRRQDDTKYGQGSTAVAKLVSYNSLWVKPDDPFFELRRGDWGPGNTDRRRMALEVHLRWCARHLNASMTVGQVDEYLESGDLADLLSQPIWRKSLGPPSFYRRGASIFY